jgi:hypothetical protein
MFYSFIPNRRVLRYINKRVDKESFDNVFSAMGTAYIRADLYTTDVSVHYVWISIMVNVYALVSSHHVRGSGASRGAKCVAIAMISYRRIDLDLCYCWLVLTIDCWDPSELNASSCTGRPESTASQSNVSVAQHQQPASERPVVQYSAACWSYTQTVVRDALSLWLPFLFPRACFKLRISNGIKRSPQTISRARAARLVP